jgi:hypothetical protein
MRESIPQGRVVTRYGRGVEGRTSIAARLMLVMVVVAGVACGDGETSDAGGCPDGMTRWTSTNEIEGPGEDTREAAIERELAEHGLEATAESIVAGVVSAAPGGDAGTERVDVELDDGTVATMTLTPLEPGWAVSDAAWCAASAP